jgi:coenzyme PQQ precursor peptide PqqA
LRTDRFHGVIIAFNAPQQERIMAWNTPELVEICIGMEINAYAPAEF